MRVKAEEFEKLMEIRDAALEYIREVDNPAPDLTMRRILRERLAELLGEREGV